MNINHVFKSECPNVEEFNECVTLDAYLEILKKQSDKVKTAKYIEHGFEALIEAVIQVEIGAVRTRNYKPIPSCDNDLFVHGVGEKKNGNKVAVMACLVKDETIPLTSNANHLTAFTSNAVEKFGVAVDETKGLKIFTNAKSLNEDMNTTVKNDKAITFFLKSDIERLVNGNMKLWKGFKKAMGEREVTVIEKPVELREFQKEASKEVSINTIGQVILPTGTGKSLIAINALYNEIKTLSITNKSPCMLIMTPRIVLTYQLLGEVIHYLKSYGLDAQYLNLNSGEFNDDAIKRELSEKGLPIRDVPSTTTKRELEYYYDKAVKDGVPFIISATYQSAYKIVNTKIPIHMAIYDEAHNLVVGRLPTKAKEGAHKIKATKKLFLTATRALSKDIDEEVNTDNTTPYRGDGMDNEEKYGKVIYHKSPKEMIDAGEIVPPYLHIVNVPDCEINGVKYTGPMSEEIEKNTELMAYVVEASFDEHLKEIKKHSCAPDKIGAKVVVVCSGDPSFRGFFYSKSFEDIKLRRKDIKFFGISSNFGAWIDGEHIEAQGTGFKEKFMLALRNLKPEDNAIVFHIDMLGEGIDVTGITGVLPFRELGIIKSCQTVGRAMRIVKDDRKTLYDGTRLANERDGKMIKPYAWVIIPVYSTNHEEIKNRVSGIIKKIRNDYGYMPYEKFIVHTPIGKKPELGEIPPLTNYNAPDFVNIKHVIEDVEVDIAVAKREVEVMDELRNVIKSTKNALTLTE